MKYTDEELELIEAFEDNNIERVAFDNDDIKEMASKTDIYDVGKISLVSAQKVFDDCKMSYKIHLNLVGINKKI